MSMINNDASVRLVDWWIAYIHSTRSRWCAYNSIEMNDIPVPVVECNARADIAICVQYITTIYVVIQCKYKGVAINHLRWARWGFMMNVISNFTKITIVKYIPMLLWTLPEPLAGLPCPNMKPSPLRCTFHILCQPTVIANSIDSFRLGGPWMCCLSSLHV